MADGGKDVPSWVWVLVALVVLFAVMSKKSAPAYPTGYNPDQKTKPPGNGRGPDRDSASSAIGEFFGGLFSGWSRSSTTHNPDTDADDDEGEYDTSRYRVYDD